MEQHEWTSLLAHTRGCRLRPGRPPSAVDAAAEGLGAVFPVELRSLYLATDGVFDTGGQWFVLWPLAQVLARNRQAWQLEGAERATWVGFGDDGTGDPFCVNRTGGSGVWHWSPIDRVARPVADSLPEFWLGWMGGDLTV